MKCDNQSQATTLFFGSGELSFFLVWPLLWEFVVASTPGPQLSTLTLSLSPLGRGKYKGSKDR